MQHLRLAVVEAARVPRAVPALGAVVEILVGRAVEEREAVPLVLHGVRVDEVHDDPQPHPVRCVDEALQVLGRPEARTRREEAGDVVPEAAVIRMLHHGHQLHDVVPGRLDARQHAVAELRVGRHLPLLARHADVGLVDAGRLRPPDGRAVPPDVRLLRLPDLRAEEVRRGVLHHAARVGGNPLAAPAVPAHLQPVELAVADEARGKGALPHVRSGQPFELEARHGLPLREVADEPHLRRIRRPFAEDPARRRAVEAEILVRARPVREPPRAPRQFGGTGLGMRRTPANRVRVGREIRVVEEMGRRAHAPPAPQDFSSSHAMPYLHANPTRAPSSSGLGPRRAR